MNLDDGVHEEPRVKMVSCLVLYVLLQTSNEGGLTSAVILTDTRSIIEDKPSHAFIHIYNIMTSDDRWPIDGLQARGTGVHGTMK